MTTPRWSLITVTYNSAATLQQHWASPRPPDVEWIVVDNRSRDGSAATARDLGADQVLELPRNVGFGRANNAGFGQARGSYVAFVNPDVVVDFDSLSRLEDALDTHPGLVGPQLVYPDGASQPSGRGVPSLTNKVLSRLGVERVLRRYHIEARPGETATAAWLVGAAVVATRDTFASFGTEGPWDPAFFVYYEDSDLGLRSWLKGTPVHVVGDARWIHSWARETTSLRLKPWLLEMRAMWTFYRRYPDLVAGEARRGRFREMAGQWGTRTQGTIA
ncbi:glycosyltransferase [Cellulomonas sp.]|uniref:glycosyltransferase n=1 Tax=Cellulomonas sp. TaxID=40001 RepID=UPI001B22747D|nr:glycosyltransferase [Cellulomonas sp.]MBO9556771.1 glycosyltransferase [Cellulomonas sp.]